MKRGTIVTYAFVLLLVSVNSLYGMFELGELSGIERNWALAGASVAWFIGYVYARGDTWGSAGNAGKVLMAVSWALLLGMSYTQVVPDFIGSYDLFGFAAVAVHSVSFYNVSFRNK